MLPQFLQKYQKFLSFCDFQSRLKMLVHKPRHIGQKLALHDFSRFKERLGCVSQKEVGGIYFKHIGDFKKQVERGKLTGALDTADCGGLTLA